MGYMNVPDDWHSFWSTCGTCGSKYHDSEGGCPCEDYEEEEEEEEFTVIATVDGVKYEATITGRTVSIDAAGHWATSGDLTECGIIENCPGNISEAVFEALDAAIAEHL